MQGAEYCVHCGTRHTIETGITYEGIALTDKTNSCNCCGTTVEEWYRYCPYCGKRPGSIGANSVGSAPDETVGFWGSMVNLWMFFGVWNGRTTRREFWYGVLCWDLIALVLVIPITVILELYLPVLGTIISYGVGAAVNVAQIAAMNRRLHDVGRTAKDLWFLLLPLVGVVILYIRLAAPSHPQGDDFGPYITRENWREHASWRSVTN